MSDLVTALGLVLAVEGILFAAVPEATKRAMYEASQTPRDRVRIVGIASGIVGVLIVWLVRG
jgi:uncharacterized protein YjeT (DUF2065 family)